MSEHLKQAKCDQSALCSCFVVVHTAIYEAALTGKKDCTTMAAQRTMEFMPIVDGAAGRLIAKSIKTYEGSKRMPSRDYRPPKAGEVM